MEAEGFESNFQGSNCTNLFTLVYQKFPTSVAEELFLTARYIPHLLQSRKTQPRLIAQSPNVEFNTVTKCRKTCHRWPRFCVSEISGGPWARGKNGWP